MIVAKVAPTLWLVDTGCIPQPMRLPGPVIFSGTVPDDAKCRRMLLLQKQKGAVDDVSMTSYEGVGAVGIHEQFKSVWIVPEGIVGVVLHSAVKDQEGSIDELAVMSFG